MEYSALVHIRIWSGLAEKQSFEDMAEETGSCSRCSSSWRSSVSWFLGFTSIGGLAQTQATDTSASRAVWTVIFVLGAVLTVWNFGAVMDDYHANKVSD